MMKALVVAIGVALFCVGAGACEVVLTHAEIAADRSRAVEFFGPSAGAKLSYSVGTAGDINGDGFDDFALAASLENAFAGAVYLVFGRPAAAWASATFDFSAEKTPEPASWIRINATEAVRLGSYGVAHGDFNGDGLSDVIIGTDQSGLAYVVYGHVGAWDSFTTDDIEHNNVPGFVITGFSATVARFVGNAGDMNGDGIEDMLVSLYDSAASEPARSYIIFGTYVLMYTSFGLNAIDGTNGFSVTDGSSTFGAGAMGSAGDINGDGLADIVLGNQWANGGVGRAYVLFARNVSETGQWASSLTVSPANLDGTNGFIIEGPASSQLGLTAVGAGNVDADGFADIFIGAGAAGAWVVHGHPAPWTPLSSASLLDGSDGFHFATSAGEYWGQTGAGVGDINGDGFEDIIVGGWNSIDSKGVRTGAAAILFGHHRPFPAELNQNNAAGSIGFLIDGPLDGSAFGISVRRAGDVNGDGLADFLVGAPSYQGETGYAVLVFGSPDDHCAVCSNTTDACLVCDNGYVLSGTLCEVDAQPTSSGDPSEDLSSSVLSGSSDRGGDHPQQDPSSSSSVPNHPDALLSSQSSSLPRGNTVVVIIIIFEENITDPTELEEEIAIALGIDPGLISIVLITPTEVEVTIIGSEELGQRLVNIINNGIGSESGLGLLRKAISAYIRKDADDGSGGVDTAPRAQMSIIVAVVAAVTLLGANNL